MWSQRAAAARPAAAPTSPLVPSHPVSDVVTDGGRILEKFLNELSAAPAGGSLQVVKVERETVTLRSTHPNDSCSHSAHILV